MSRAKPESKHWCGLQVHFIWCRFELRCPRTA
jgi:hypothetical protein